MRKKVKQEAVDKIAIEIHQMVSTATIGMYNSVKKLIDPTVSEEDKAKASDIVNKMMITAESLFEDLTDSQKEIYRSIVRDLMKVV